MALTNKDALFKTIEAPYCCGYFGGLELIFNQKENMFNATKLTHQEGKRFRHWLENQHTKKLIMCFPPYSDEDTFEVKKEKIFKTYLSGSTDIDKFLQGTYIPQELLLNLANWISPECFIKTTKIVQSHNINKSVVKHKRDNENLNLQVENLNQNNRELTTQIKLLTNQNQCQAAQHLVKTNELTFEIEQLANQINQKNIEISEQASKIKQLEDQNQQLMEQIAQHIAKINELASEIEHLAGRIEHLVDQNQQLTDQIDILQARIERYIAYERDIVPATVAKSKWHTFTLIDTNDGSRSPYYLLRVQRRSKKQRLKHLKIKYPRMEIAFEIDRVPNSINLVNRMRERLTNVKIHFNHLKLLNNYTVHDLIQDIEALTNNRQLLKLG